MTQFNPQNKEQLTYGEILDPAMQIKDSQEAQKYLSDYIQWIQSDLDQSGKKDDAAKIAKANLGYWAGYYSNDVRKRVEKLFLCEHPLFGSIEKNGPPTMKQAFEIGYNYSKNKK